MNALLGRPTRPIRALQDGGGPMPTDDLPCTATLTSIAYADEPYARVWHFDNSVQEWSLERYLRDATVKDDEEETEAFFRNIRQFELGYPAELLRSGVTLYDSPGTSDTPQRTEVAQQAIDRCDAALVVYRSDVLAGSDERDFESVVVKGGTRVFTVINLRDGKRLDERLKRFTWNRLVKPRGLGAYEEGSDLAAQDIYFVNALRAFDGKMAGDTAAVATSGMATLEERLGEFLLRERHHTHLQKFVKLAELGAALIEQQVAQRRAALDRDEEALQRAYEQIQPQLRDIRQRRERLPRIIQLAQREFERQARTSFQAMINRLRQDLPDMLASRPMPSLQGATRIIYQVQHKKLLREATTLCDEIVLEHVNRWRETEVPALLTPILERMLEEINDEVAAIDRQFANVHLQMTGLNVTDLPGQGLLTMKERVLSSVVGLVLGGPALALMAPGAGWRGVAGAAAGQFVTGFALAVFGLTTSAIALPLLLAVTAAGVFLGNSFGLEGRIKANAIKVYDGGLRQAAERIADTDLVSQVQDLFKRLEEALMGELLATIEDEERNIQNMIELNKLNQVEKAQSRARFDTIAASLADQRRALADVLVRAKQSL